MHATPLPPTDREDSGILRAAKIIDQILDDPIMRDRLLTQRVINYLLHRVMVIRMPIDRITLQHPSSSRTSPA